MEMGMQSRIKDSLPFTAMVIVEFGEVVMVTLAKAAMNSGMSNLVYVVYSNTLGTLILLPFFIIHTNRINRPPLTFSLLCRLFRTNTVGCQKTQYKLSPES
ncbi:LOW QUALITY PROTEIN: hypothetical protein RJ639_006596 [Escallonia herrerae]|uniref:WAT1-related protein n=1 Tax=Escallonia herrerae TaxID=1293975 RepID=A0AA88VZT7_9ASTE|nr:LOW QUALITY PROTEIN: hypothetical protein RJ639_006596 [Escallonia herrerae]